MSSSLWHPSLPLSNPHEAKLFSSERNKFSAAPRIESPSHWPFELNDRRSNESPDRKMALAFALALLIQILVRVAGVSTEEELVGGRLTIHPIEQVFQRFLEENEQLLGTARQINEFSIHHTIVRSFCFSQALDKNRRSAGDLAQDKSLGINLGACTHDEYLAALNVLRRPFNKHFDPGRRGLDPEKLIRPWLDKRGLRSECARIDNPSMAEFMAYVVRSEPVIITGVANEWPAINKWTWKYLLEKIGDQQVIASVSPHKGFDGPEPVELWSDNITDTEYIIARPAQVPMKLSQFYGLLYSEYTKDAYFYLQYLPLKVVSESLVEDVGKIKDTFARFLDPQLQLIWLGDGRNGGWIHHDKQENLMAMIAGSKTFHLIPPLADQSEYLYGGIPMRGAGLEYRWSDTEKSPETGLPKANFVRDPSKISELNEYQTYTPIRIDQPDYEKYPKSKNLKVITCHVETGEILFNPSHWWHEVQSGADEEGKSVGINWFLGPMYHHFFANSSTFEPNRLYMHLADALQKSSSNDLNLKELFVGTNTVEELMAAAKNQKREL